MSRYFGTVAGKGLTSKRSNSDDDRLWQIGYISRISDITYRR
jgi:hypothetical protein